MAEQMTVQKLVLSMFNTIAMPVTEKEYELVGLSRLQILKRRRFSNIYRTLVLYLIKLSIPQAFPEQSKEIIDKFNECFELAYRGNLASKGNVERRLREFTELVVSDKETRFGQLALYIVEEFEGRPRKWVYVAQLTTRINELYESFSSIGTRVQIVEDLQNTR